MRRIPDTWPDDDMELGSDHGTHVSTKQGRKIGSRFDARNLGSEWVKNDTVRHAGGHHDRCGARSNEKGVNSRSC